MKKIYVGCALTHAPKSFVQFIFDLRNSIKELGFEVLEFGWDKDAGPNMDRNVYDYDVAHVDEADYFVAICDHPSIGLGIELERAFSTNTPTLAFYHTDAHISKIITDGLVSKGMLAPTPYASVDDILETIQTSTR